MRPKILDLYISKKLISTFLSILFIFIPIGILINLIDWLHSIIENDLSFYQIIEYYTGFSIYFANILYPILLFLSVIWFTTKLASNSEITCMLSSGISFWQFFKPYLVCSFFIFLFGLLFSLFIAPSANKVYRKYNQHILRSKSVDEGSRNSRDIYKKINDNDIIYFQNINIRNQTGTNFVLEHFEDHKLAYRFSAPHVTYNETTSQLILKNVKKEYISKNNYKVIHVKTDSITLPIKFKHLSQLNYKAETLNFFELNQFIKEEIERGSPEVRGHLINKYKRFSIPFSIIILIFIGVLFSYKKKRTGFGINLFLGILLGFSYVFLDRIFTIIISQTDTSLLLGVWLPNIFLSIIVIILLIRESR